MAFKAKFDGTCEACGKPVIGYINHGRENAHEITWARRGPSKGKVMHSNPTCAQVAAGINTPVASATTTVDEPETVETVLGIREEKDVVVSTPVKTAPDASAVNAILEALKNAGVTIPDAAVEAVVPTKKVTKLSNNAKWYQCLEALLNAMSKRILLVGPPGTGKSTTASKIAEALSKSVYRITMTEGTGVEDLLGMFQLKNDGTGTKTEFVYGPAANWLKNGGMLQIDEITHTPPEIQSLLYCLLDDAPVLTLPNGDVLKAHKDCIAIGTTNDNAAQLEPALMDRCEAILLATVPHPASLKDCSAAESACVMNYYKSIDITPWKFNRPAQVRPVRSFSRLNQTGMFESEILAQCIFGESGKEFLSSVSTAASTAKSLKK